MQKQISYKIVSLVFGILVLCFAIAFYAVGWTEPQQAPPGCTPGQPGCDPPVNVGGTSQSKSGALGIGGVFRAWGGAVGPNDGLTVSNGNVGIGTVSPGARLEVKAGVEGQASLVKAIKIWGPNTPANSNSAQDLSWDFAAAGSAKIRAYRGGSWDTYLQFLTNAVGQGSDNPQVRMTINEAGNVGIGTTNPVTTLTVKPTAGHGIVVREADDGNHAIAIVSDNTQGVIDIYSGGTIATHLPGSGSNYFNGGNVGIGDTSPDSGTGGQLKLDVEGPIGATRYCDENGNNCKTVTEIQQRVTDACGANQAIKVINANGTVVCTDIPVFANCTNGSVAYSPGEICCCQGFLGMDRLFVCQADSSWDLYVYNNCPLADECEVPM